MIYGHGSWVTNVSWVTPGVPPIVQLWNGAIRSQRTLDRTKIAMAIANIPAAAKRMVVTLDGGLEGRIMRRAVNLTRPHRTTHGGR